MPLYQQDWIQKWAVYSPRKIAIREYESGRQFSYLQLNRLANRLTHILAKDYGIKKGDRIALLAENCLEYPILFSAAQKMGCILAPFNFRLAKPEINFLIENANPALIIFDGDFQNTLNECSALHPNVRRLTIESLREILDPDQENPEDEQGIIESLKENDPILILYTSGTTGFPKGALYTHKMLFWNSINTALSLILNAESRTITCMPLFHTGGWNVLLTPFLHHGGYVCLMKKFDAPSVLKLLEVEKPTIFMGVPTMLKMMADLPAFKHTDCSSLYYIIVGGESMPIPLIERWHEKGVPIRQGYGMTEVGPNLTSLHQDDAIRKKGSIGRPNFYVHIKIADEEGGEMDREQNGELWLKGPMVTPGYWKNPEASRSATKNGWFRTGDVVRQDAEGYLYITGRMKDMYISGGENVYPAEVERVLLSHPAVSEAAVIGVADPKWGESGKAILVLKDQKRNIKEELVHFCQKNLAKFKVPKHFIFLEQLPKNETGKIDRKTLKNKFKIL